MKNKILKKLFAFVFVFCLLSGAAVYAENTNVSMPIGQEIGTDYIAAGDTVDISSNVRGDVILAGSNVDFSGNADGDILIAASDARVNGNSLGDVRIVGGSIILEGSVAKNVTIIGSNVIINESSVIEGNLYVAGGKVDLRGEVKGIAKIYCSDLIFSGKVGGDADFRSNTTSVLQDSVIDGNFTYATGSSDFVVGEGVVKGSVTQEPMKNLTDNYTKGSTTGAGVVIWQFLSLLMVVLVLTSLFAKQVKALTVPITKKEVWQRIATGFIWLVVNPIVILVAILTVVGAPLALMILFVYIVLIICAMAISPMLLGNMVNERLRLYVKADKNLWKDFISGYVAMQIIGLVPVLGSLALLLLFLFSFGRVAKYVAAAVKENG
ncbi:MAG: hypothetical protein PHX30_03320 [Candidatus Pacebacteria bacterium]|nr:hypothetical protein [Candidatus Paceibacterota bacterium]